MAENTKTNAALNTHKWLPVSGKNIRIRDQLKDFWTPHVIRSTLIPSICKSKLVWPSYSICKITVSFLWNVFFVLSFIMHYTEYLSMHHYAGFSQIGSHITVHTKMHITNYGWLHQSGKESIAEYHGMSWCLGSCWSIGSIFQCTSKLSQSLLPR